MLNKKLRNAIILSIIIFLCLLIVTVSLRDSDKVKGIRAKALDFFRPIQEKIHSFFYPLIKAVNTVKDYFGLIEKVRALEEENSRLLKDYSENINLKVENNALRKLLGVKQRNKFDTKLAKVIGFYESRWQSEAILNVGRSDGVLEGMGVITEKGLVGVVILSSNSSCRVRLINDPQSSIGARVLSSRKVGMVEGSLDKKVYLKYIPKDDIIFRGDIVITSEYSKLLPPEIVIGRVKRVSVSKQSPYKEIEIEPFVDFRELEYVLVVTR
ncbi:MAG: rod shape-determining protein MreC [Actinobacteria bacterium]|nr:rod shape-determining protein MreC [Actinomycetota bacterium]